MTLMFYEHFLCLKDEISLVWLGRWTMLQTIMLADVYIREAGMLFIALGKEFSVRARYRKLIVPSRNKRLHQDIVTSGK